MACTDQAKDLTELGFVEKVDSWHLLSHYFPSKVGGKPAWLSLKYLPSMEELTCKLCDQVCVFLLQVYANLDDKDDCFHRSIFVFICKNPNCLKTDASQCVLAFRSQLPKINDFYSSDPPPERGLAKVYPKAEDFQKLCIVCGCVGTKTCSKCQSVTYCSKGHQAVDWKACHKKQCGKSQEASVRRGVGGTLFPEFELVTEPESCNSESEDEEKSEEQKLAEYEGFLKQAKGGKTTEKTGPPLTDLPEDELEKMARGVTDEVFEAFQQRVKREPEQVLRYNRGGTPLWVASQTEQPTIPKCQCGANRQFEFQIMPQLLNHLSVDSVDDSLDWGTLIVYTCRDSCPTGARYVREYVLKQDFTNTDSVPDRRD